MKKFKFLTIIVLITFALISCKEEIIVEYNQNIEVNFNDVDEIRLRTQNNSINIDDIDGWQEFIENVSIIDYATIPMSEVTEKIETDEAYFTIDLIIGETKRSFLVLKDTIYTTTNELEGLYSKDKYAESVFIELSQINFPAGSLLCKKPIIYLYPEKAMEIQVTLETDCEITVSYPEYNHSWNVFVDENGKIKDTNGKEYAYLYWEGLTDKKLEIENGFVIKGDKTADFLDDKLKVLGLNYKERNDFITYWLPEMVHNNYNKIHFMTDEYDSIAKLNINPSPDSLIRVFMLFEPLEKFEKIEAQILENKVRSGYTVVDWGGAEIE